MTDKHRVSTTSASAAPLRRLIVLGVLSWLIYAAVAWLSRRFVYVEPQADTETYYALLRQRPIVEVLLLLGAAFGLYVAALRTAVRCAGDRRLIETIVLFGFCFRGLLLVSPSIQEVDSYRYVWDGAVVAAGVSPFRYSPEQVREAEPDGDLPYDLRRLAALRDSSESLRVVLGRVHYGHLPTVYPPVSQAVFAAAAATTPDAASVEAHLAVMRCWLLLFDMATVGVLLLILRHVGMPPGWAVAYAWCPLVIKEFANSGHHDSIAVFFSMLAVYWSLKALYPRWVGETGRSLVQELDRSSARSRLVWSVAAGAALALAVGAKLYPVVLFPLFLVGCFRGLGWRRTLMPAVAFALTAAAVCAPLLLSGAAADVPQRHADSAGDDPPLPQAAGVTPGPSRPQNPRRGLQAFFNHWEMNDFLFLVVVENLDPADHRAPEARAWFVVTPQSWRERVAQRLSELVNRTWKWGNSLFPEGRLPRRGESQQADVGEPALAERVHVSPVGPASPDRIPFWTTRALLATVFLVLTLWYCRKAWRRREAGVYLEAAFLTLAWFWLLLPTQNPWYWIWALPLVPFARGRAWLAVSGLVFLYYLRFWLGYHWPDRPVAGTRYSGTLFFDFVVTWVEFAPWLVWLLAESVRNRGSRAV